MSADVNNIDNHLFETSLIVESEKNLQCEEQQSNWEFMMKKKKKKYKKK